MFEDVRTLILCRRTWVTWVLAFVVVVAQPAWAAMPSFSASLPAATARPSPALPAWFTTMAGRAAPPAAPLPDWFSSVPQPRPLFQPAPTLSKYTSVITATRGQVFTYTLVFTIPAGVNVTGLALSDQLPSANPRIQVVNGSAVGPIPVSGGGPALDTTVTYGTYNIDWDTLGDVNNPGPNDYVYSATYRARVNPWTSGAGDVGTNQATLSWDGGSDGASVGVTIVLPDMQVKRMAYTSRGEQAESEAADPDLLDLRADDVITFTLWVTNVASSFSSPAYDVRVRDILPNWVEYDGLIAGPTPQVTLIGTRREVEWMATNRPPGTVPELNVLGLGEVFMASYRGRVVAGVAPGLSRYLQTQANYYYLPGGSDADRNAEIQFRTPDINVVKLAVDEPPQQTRVHVGEVVTYTVSYTFPWGTTIYTPTYLYDQLDDGLRFMGVVSKPVEVVALIVNESQEFDTLLQWYIAAPLTFAGDLRHTYVFTARVAPTHFLGSDAGQAVGQGQELINEATLYWDDQDSTERSSNTDDSAVWLVRPAINPVKWKQEPQDEFPGAGVDVRFELRSILNVSATYDAVAYNVVVTDALPQGWSYVGAVPPPSGTTAIGGRTIITWGPVVSLPVNNYLPGPSLAETMYVVTATSPPTVIAGAPYTNTVEVGYDSDQGYRYADRDDLVMWLPLPAFKEITPSSPYSVGQVITYTLVSTVAPQSILYWPRHVDTLPAGVRYTGWYAASGGTLLGNPVTGVIGTQEVITWHWYPLDNSAGLTPLPFSFSFEAALVGWDTAHDWAWPYYNSNPAFQNRSTIEWNTENVSGTYAKYAQVDRGYGLERLLQPYLVDPDWLPAKALVGGGPPVESGDLFTYHLTLYNTGWAPAYEVVISDQLPAGVEFVSYAASMFNQWAGESYTPIFSAAPTPGESGVIGWVVAEVNSNYNNNRDWPTQLNLTYTLRTLPGVGSGAALWNSAWISDYTSLPGEQPYERHYVDMPAAGDYQAGPVSVVMAGISKSASVTEMAKGDTVVFTITVPDPSLGATLYNVAVLDTMPGPTPGPLHVLGASTSGPVPTSFDFTSDTVTATYSSIPAYAQATIVIVARAPSTATGGTVQNVAQVSWEDAASGGGSHATSDAVDVIISTSDVAVTKDAVGAAPQGFPLVYTIIYENLGPATASDVRLTDTLPVSVTYVGYSSDRPITEVVGFPNPLAWELGSLSSGERGTIWLTATVWLTAPLGSSLVNSVTIHTSTSGDDPANNQDTHTTFVGGSFLDVRKRVSPDPVQAGELLYYTLVVTNDGSLTTANLVITDRVPLNTTFDSASGGVTPVGGVLTWTPGDIAAGNQVEVTFTVRVNSPLVSGTQIINAQYGASADNAPPVGPFAPVVVTVHSQPSLYIAKLGAATTGSDVDMAYTIYYRNTGNAVAHNVRITENYDAYVDYVTAVPPPDVPPQVWQIGPLTPTTSDYTILVTVHVSASVADGAILTNTVFIDSDETAALSDTVYTLVGEYSLYMPVLFKDYTAPLPPFGVNLMVSDIQVGPPAPTVGEATRITVTLYNSGTNTISADFWVDLYVDPSTTPTVNVVWNEIAPYGKAWFVHDDIPADGTLVIHTDQPDDAQDPGAIYSNWPGWFVSAGEHVLYVQVDSYGLATGLVLEDDETDNVRGPLTVTVVPSSTLLAPPPPIQWQERR